MPIYKVVVEGGGWEEYEVEAKDKDTALRLVEDHDVEPYFSTISLVERTTIEPMDNGEY